MKNRALFVVLCFVASVAIGDYTYQAYRILHKRYSGKHNNNAPNQQFILDKPPVINTLTLPRNYLIQLRCTEGNELQLTKHENTVICSDETWVD